MTDGKLAIKTLTLRSFIWILVFAMHAYLIIGNRAESKEDSLEDLARKLKAKTLEFPLAKIDDVRALNSFVSLSVTEPTAIILKNIDNATTEALNAFLKNLEEPQESLYFLLTARSTLNVLPTIVSRCQVVRVQDSRFPALPAGGKIQDSNSEKFIKMDTGERLAFMETLRKRDEALVFVEDFILACHERLAKGVDLATISKFLKAANYTRRALKQNGNVTIQLTNLVVNLGAF